MITASNYVMAILKDVRTNQLEERLSAGSAWQNPDDFIFTHADGHHLSHSVVRRHFKDLAQAIGMTALRFHSTAFILDTYAHETEAMKKESTKRMEVFIQDTL
ncbi:MAG: hypothetical protein ACRCSI_09355 [Eubacterium aggregans]